MLLPRLQHVFWLWRIITFVVYVVITDTFLVIKVHIAVRNAANVAQVKAAITGGRGSREPENEDETLEDQLTNYEPWKEPSTGRWT